MKEHLEHQLAKLAGETARLQDYANEETNSKIYAEYLDQRLGEIESELRNLWREIVLEGGI